jgi:hypothetical protein
MTKVCICGSRELGKHQEYERRIRLALEDEIRKDNWINVGDASGADRLCQQLLANEYYPNVKVWYIGNKPRNYANRYNQWEKIKVEGNYTTRDIQMLEDSDKLIALWDNKSKGTKRNIDEFKKGEVEVYTYPINITYSEKGIGGALSINDRISRQKGYIKSSYVVHYARHTYDCAIDMYNNEKMKKEFIYNLDPRLADEEVKKWEQKQWMIEVMYAKFSSNPFLYHEVKLRGGDDWLITCRHIGDRRHKWEGDGAASDYIACLTEAFIRIDRVMTNRPYYC